MSSILKGYDFDDLLLVPRLSDVNSRDDVDLSVKLSDFLTLKIPIIASPMKGIISIELIDKLSKLGGIGILHRFYKTNDEWLGDVNQCSMRVINYGVSIGLNDNRYKLALYLGAKIICIDVANGYLDIVRKFSEEVKNYIVKENHQALLMTGNVVTYDGVASLRDSGVDMIRIGIGGGSVCSTRNVTGVGVPQLTAIKNCTQREITYIQKTGEVVIDKLPILVSDGGIRNSGDAVKAIAIGANLVMIGGLFAETFESSNNGIIRGMSSRSHQEEYHHTIKSVEGIEKSVKKVRSLEDFISEFTGGMRSACTYLNAKNLKALKRNARFIETGKGSLKDI